MKKLMLTTLAILLTSFAVNAQELKNQTQQLSSIKQGSYTPYLAKWDGKGNYGGGIDDRIYKVTGIKEYRVRKNSPHKEVYIVLKGSKTNPSKHKPLMFVPDNEAFPVTYMQRVYEGNKKMQEAIGYAPRTDVYEDTRAVFLGGKIYILENWKSKEDYNLKAVLEFQEKKLKGLKMMKEVMKSPKKMKADKPHETLKNYLNKAFKKQKEVYASWVKEPRNRAIEERTVLVRDLVNKAIKKSNDDFKKSDTWKRIQEVNAMSERQDKEERFWVDNGTGRAIYLYEGSSRNGSLVRAGTKSSYQDCKKSWSYSFSSGGAGTKIPINTPGQNCGRTVKIN